MKESSAPLVLHRAAWVAPMSRPPIADGGVLTAGGAIAEVGSYAELKASRAAGAELVDHGAAALIPCLVNAHTHLELSLLGGKIPLPQPGFAPWLNEVFAQRASLTDRDQLAGCSLGRRQLLAGGAGLYGDITNGACLLPESEDTWPVRQTFLEVLGFDRQDLRSTLAPEAYGLIANQPRYLGVAAHACYSTSAQLIKEAKRWCRDRGQPFSIHVAEHAEEIKFLQNGTGYCRELLERLGRWDPGWAVPATTPIAYLDSLGVLDVQTLLVHAVHMEESDWQLVRRRGCCVCFCPRSNHHLNVGRPDIERASRLGLKTCLGTDSLASNRDLNLFAEAQFVLQHYPGVPPEAVLHMMTMGGAAALCRQDRFGCLERGRQAAFLAVTLNHPASSSELCEAIICQGNQGEWKWVNHARNI